MTRTKKNKQIQQQQPKKNKSKKFHFTKMRDQLKRLSRQAPEPLPTSFKGRYTMRARNAGSGMNANMEQGVVQGQDLMKFVGFLKV